MHGNELYHHGVLGMKWGVRRYQNKDGSLTSAGKHRYSRKDARKKWNEYYDIANERENNLYEGKYRKRISQLENDIDNGTRTVYYEDDDGREKVAYRIKDKKSERSYEELGRLESQIEEEGEAYAKKYIEKKYGAESVKDIQRYERENMALVMGILAAAGGISIFAMSRHAGF